MVSISKFDVLNFNRRSGSMSESYAGKINRNDFDAELWMGGKHK